MTMPVASHGGLPGVAAIGPGAPPVEFRAAGSAADRTARSEDPAAAATSIQFSYDRASGRVIVRIVSKETGEILRQIPPEEYLAFVARFRELLGAIFDRRI